ncbi:MAG TPA: hypothetical protein DIW47_12860 [Bacteroidetes bacterium]|nr:hypothetical protein [Bacteroidota bacterium]
MRILVLFILISGISSAAFSQGCCSGGSASPIAGGISQGVLQKGEMELSSNYQFFSSGKFYAGDRDTIAMLSNLSSHYLYSRIAFGVTERFTMSIEGGYFFVKKEIGFNPNNIDNTKRTSGIADLVLFPRYTVFNKSNKEGHSEVTIGLGLKIPLGSCNDSTLVYVNPNSGQEYYTTSPPTIQTTTGSNDFIFYGFFYHEYKKPKLRLFANALYVKKGWNALGQKFGDYASIGLFASKTYFKKLGVTLQLKGEWVAKMKAAPGLDMLAMYNIDVHSTGLRKISFAPQLSYTHRSLTVFAINEFPLYQYLNGAQIGFQHLVTLGVSYRFFVPEPAKKEPEKP